MDLQDSRMRDEKKRLPNPCNGLCDGWRMLVRDTNIHHKGSHPGCDELVMGRSAGDKSVS